MSIARFYDIHMEERTLPDDEAIQKVTGERITALLEAKLRARDNLQLERMRRFQPLARHLSQSDEGLSLMVMLLDDYYQQSLHAPPEQPTADIKEEKPDRPEKTEKTDKPAVKKRRPRSRSRSSQKEL